MLYTWTFSHPLLPELMSASNDLDSAAAGIETVMTFLSPMDAQRFRLYIKMAKVTLIERHFAEFSFEGAHVTASVQSHPTSLMRN